MTVAVVLGVAAGLAMLVLLWRPFFGSWVEFRECVGFWFTPDVISLFRGDYHRDRMAEFKLGLWLFASGGAGFVVFLAVRNLLGA